MIITILAFIFVFGLLVFVHELGHFLAARWMGVTVKTFAFGFPPTLFSRKVGDTVYKVNAIPLGGYVSMLGEEESQDIETETEQSHTDPGSLLSKDPWQKIVIMFAGVFMNVVLAVLLFLGLYLVGFQPIIDGMADYNGISNTMKVQIVETEKGSPAEKAGILPADYIAKVDGTPVYNDSQVVALISKKQDPTTTETKLTIIRNDETIEKSVTAYESKVKLANGKEQTVSRVGITLSNTGKIQGGLGSSLVAAVSTVWRITTLTLEGIVGLFRQLIFQFRVSEEVSGPVGIVVMTNYFAQLGFLSLIQFAAILSISLAIFNILPIPALDGGQIFVTGIELLFRRKFSQKLKNVIQVAGFAFIIGLFLVITVKDLLNFGIIKYVIGWF